MLLNVYLNWVIFKATEFAAQFIGYSLLNWRDAFLELHYRRLPLRLNKYNNCLQYEWTSAK